MLNRPLLPLSAPCGLQEDERDAEETLSRCDPEGTCELAWSRGIVSVGTELVVEPTEIPAEEPGADQSGDEDAAHVNGTSASPDGELSVRARGEGAGAPAQDPPSSVGGGGGGGSGGGGVPGAEASDEGGAEARRERMARAVPEYRLNSFVYACPLVSEECKFTAKLWLQDEDDG